MHLTIQVDTLAHKIPGFVEKAALAGCKKVFIGLENINPDSLTGASKGQKRITEYRAMLQAWHHAKVITYAGYILGFPNDSPSPSRGISRSFSVSCQLISSSFLCSRHYQAPKIIRTSIGGELRCPRTLIITMSNTRSPAIRE